MKRTIAIAWAAGLFEGEGCVVYGASHRGPLRAKISSTDRDVLDMMVERTGVGAVYGPRAPNGFGVKPFYEWIVNGRAARDFLMEILPMMGQRRAARIRELVALWESRPLAPVADQDAMRADRALGMTYADIGRKHGVSTARAFQVCRDGLTMHRRWAVAPTE